ncbi:MAG: pyridoxal phosphate-dependent aminotransferase [Deltaproteobacteria bacterium]|nr:pyridoxal phosphate-dependent aminotransferase [Deltaproteobacteria bacterium]
MYLNSRIQRVKPSETLAVKTRAMELKAQGRSIVDMAAGEPDIDTPEHIKEAAVKALRDGKTKYTAVNGIPELREAIAAKLRDENGLEADASTVIVTNGGKQAIYSFFDVVLEPGDEVVIPSPYWVSYPVMAEMCGGRSVIVKPRAGAGLKITPEDLRASLSPRSKCFVINSPSNPTGVAYTASELKEFAAVLKDFPNCLIISDEVYEKLIFTDVEFVSFAKAAPELANRTVTVNAFSKTYSMTGWRVGYASGPKEIIGAMGRHQSQTTSNICSIAQYAALAALQGPQDFIREMLSNFTRRFEIGYKVLESVRGVELLARPDGAFYLFIGIAPFLNGAGKGKIKGSAEFANFLLEQSGVAVVPGEAFGDDHAFRVSVSSSDDNVRAGFERLEEVMAQFS